MKAYRATFLKMNGEKREIIFARLKDLPAHFLNENAPPKKSEEPTTKKILQRGMELVWDLEKHSFRIFNWETALKVEVENHPSGTFSTNY